MTSSMLATSAPSSFILLTPRGEEEPINNEKESANATAAATTDRPRMGSTQRALVRSKTAPEEKAQAHDGKKAHDAASGSPTETDQSSDVASETEGIDNDAVTEFDVENEFGVFPAYVCELHDPKEVLTAANIQSDRVEIRVVNPPPVDEHHDKRNWAWSSNNTMCYEISVGATSSRFECSPSKVLQAFQELANDPLTSAPLRMIETDYFRNGLVGTFKRLYPSAVKLCAEIVELLEAISDVDTVLLHPSFLELVEISKGQAIYEELERLVQSHQHGASRSPDTKCMCAVYLNSVERFASLYKPAIEETPVARYSVVASESFMQARSILSFFSDTMYVLDKRDFRPFRGLNKCVIYGFGRRKLFEIVHTSRRQWAFRHVNQGTVATLTLEHYMHNMNPYNMIAIRRVIPGGDGVTPREEEVCYVKRSKKHGYRCMLMAEVISRGRVTTALTLEHVPYLADDGSLDRHHYKTMSEVSDLARESICSSLLSVSANPHKHLQHVRVSSGSDVVTFLALAVSYDMLVSPLVYMKERRY